jgi:DNA adenine methylase
MQYLGGKPRIAKYLAPFLRDALAECGGRLYEPFVGGYNIMPAIRSAVVKATCADAHPGLPVLYAALRDGWMPPKELPEYDYDRLKEARDWSDPLTTFAAFGCSFGGMEFGSYAYRVEDSGAVTNYAGNARRKLLRSRATMDVVEFIHTDYRELEIETPSVIYCDPPYVDTTGYKGVDDGAFDHEAFYAWCEELAGRGCRVFVSEFTRPDRENWPIVWSKKRKTKSGLTTSTTRDEILMEVRPLSEYPGEVEAREVRRQRAEETKRRIRETGQRMLLGEDDDPLSIGYQMPLFSPGRDSGYVPPLVSDLPMWKDAKRVCIDVETRDEELDALGPGVHREGCFVCGFAVSVDWGTGRENYEHFYVPVNHFGGGNVEDPTQAWAWLRDNARAFRGDVVNAWLAYDLRWMGRYDVRFPLARGYEDPLVNSPLINELPKRHNLDVVLQRAGFPGKDLADLCETAHAHHKIKAGASIEEVANQARKNIWKYHAGDSAPYAVGDVSHMFDLVDQQHEEIARQGLEDIWRLEREVLPVAAKMSERGVRIDWEHLERVDKRIQKNIERQLRIVRDHTLVTLRPPDPEEKDNGELDRKAALKKVFDAAGVELPLTEKSGEICTTKEVLEERAGHPVVAAILSARNSNGMRKMFVNQVRKMAVGDRIHCTFNQIKGDNETGKKKRGTIARFSATNPSLQNQPRRGEEGKFFRRSYVPEESCRWVKVDYSGQELRLMLHYAALSMLCDDRNRVPAATIEPSLAKIRANPKWKLHKDAAEISGAGYDEAKIGVFQYAYGAGFGKICQQLGYPTEPGETRDGRPCLLPGEEGRRILSAIFDQGAPFIRPLRKHVEEVADGRGYITTILGRRQRFERELYPKPGENVHRDVYKALNRLIQGSAADQTKRAMVELDRLGVPLQLQVHDEVDFSTDDESLVRRAAEVMEGVVRLEVPVLADIETGSTWGTVDKGWAQKV